MANDHRSNPPSPPKSLDVAKELASLKKKSAGELADVYVELFKETCRSRNKTWLVRRIIWRMQANAEGDLSERARQRAAELAVDAEVRTTPPKHSRLGFSRKSTGPRDSRLPLPGTSLIRKYKGKTIQVNVTPDGFDWEGERYQSLSAVAKAITGSHCNGFRFFNLGGEQ